MARAKKSGITIAQVTVRDFHRLEFAEVEHVPGEGLVRVQGKNGSGKSSFLRAIMAGLGGAGEVRPDVIREGAETGEVRIALTNGFTVRRRFTEAAPKGYLTVEGPDGGKHTQGKLAEWLGAHAFDPAAFFALAPARQRDLLFSLGTNPELPEQLAEARREYSRVYEERTPVISRRRYLRSTTRPEGDRPEPVDVSGEMQRLAELQRQGQERAVAAREVEGLLRDGEAHARRVKDGERRVAELEEALRVARGDLAQAEKDLVQARGFYAEAKERADAMPDVSTEISECQARIREADQVRASLGPWEAWERAQEEEAGLAIIEEELTAELGALKGREAALLEQAGIPVDGLSFSEDGEPILNGRSLTVASGAERVRLAVQVALAANPDLRVVLLDEEANALDEDAIKALNQLAVDHGFQVWAARVASDPASEVVVVDGRATSRAPTAEEAA